MASENVGGRRLKERINAHAGRLTPSDRRLVETLLANPTASAFESAAEIAGRAGVHAAGLVRLARRLGYDGFSELRGSLRDEVIGERGTGELVRRRLAHTEGQDILHSIVARERSALEELPFHVTQADVASAASVLLAARRVLVFGEGTAETLVLFVTRRLRRAGLVVEAVHPTPRELAESLTGLTGDDAVLGFVFRRTPPLLTPLLAEARTTGAKSVLIADLRGPMLRPPPDILLAAPRGLEGEAQTLTVPMAISNAILLTLAQLGDGRPLDAMDRYAQVRDELARRL